MDIADLKMYGEALFGEKWQSQLSKKLLINRAVVQNWIRGRTKLPEYLSDEIFQLLKEKKFFVDQSLNRLDSYDGALKKAINRFKNKGLGAVEKGTVVYMRLEIDKDCARKSYQAKIQLNVPETDLEGWETYVFGTQALMDEVINFKDIVKTVLTREKAIEV